MKRQKLAECNKTALRFWHMDSLFHCSPTKCQICRYIPILQVLLLSPHPMSTWSPNHPRLSLYFRYPLEYTISWLLCYSQSHPYPIMYNLVMDSVLSCMATHPPSLAHLCDTHLLDCCLLVGQHSTPYDTTTLIAVL
jgi:hypothetical protein